MSPKNKKNPPPYHLQVTANASSKAAEKRLFRKSPHVTKFSILEISSNLFRGVEMLGKKIATSDHSLLMSPCF